MRNPGGTGTDATLTAGQRALLAKKVHVRPNALAQSSSAVQAQLSSQWQAAAMLAAQLAGLPEEAFEWWAAQPAGHLLLTADKGRYCPGVLAEEGRTLAAVALIPLHQVVRQPVAAAVAAIFPLDHLLGCGGAAHGLWLSEGGGLTPRWQRVGTQVARLHALGYGSEAARGDARVYLAEGLHMALHNRRRLNQSDPKLERLLRSSLLAAPFWQKFRQESTNAPG